MQLNKQQLKHLLTHHFYLVNGRYFDFYLYVIPCAVNKAFFAKLLITSSLIIWWNTWFNDQLVSQMWYFSISSYRDCQKCTCNFQAQRTIQSYDLECMAYTSDREKVSMVNDIYNFWMISNDEKTKNKINIICDCFTWETLVNMNFQFKLILFIVNFF